MKKIKLGEILNIKRGTTLSGEFYSNKGKKVRLTLGNFDYPGNGFKQNTSKDDLYFTGTVKPEFILKKGDIITPLTEQVSGLLGETAEIPFDDLYIQSGDIGLVKIKEGKADSNYIYYLLSSNHIKKQLGAAAQQTKIRHTSPDKIEGCVTWIPDDISTQIKIGKVLKSIDEQIQRNKDMVQKLQVLGKSIYCKNRKENEFDLLKDISVILTGKEDANHATDNGNYKFFTCSEGSLLCDDYKFDGKYVLVAGNGNFNVKFYDGKFNAYQRTYVIKNDDTFGNLYYTLFYNTDSFKKQSNGSIIKFITIDMLNRIKVPKFSNITKETLNNIVKEIAFIENDNEKLQTLKNKLLPLLINGQLQ